MDMMIIPALSVNRATEHFIRNEARKTTILLLCTSSLASFPCDRATISSSIYFHEGAPQNCLPPYRCLVSASETTVSPTGICKELPFIPSQVTFESEGPDEVAQGDANAEERCAMRKDVIMPRCRRIWQNKIQTFCATQSDNFRTTLQVSESRSLRDH
jgi:hypothetical protein